jgi:hypothetical protein
LREGRRNTPINTTEVGVNIRRDTTKNIHRSLRTGPKKCHSNQRHQPPKRHLLGDQRRSRDGVLKAYRRFMLVILSISIGSKTIFFVIIFVSRYSVVSSNTLNMICFEVAGLFAHHSRWRG